MTRHWIEHLPAELPRLGYLAFCGYALVLVALRWPATRVMTPERRFLLLFFLLELATTILGGVVALHRSLPVDYVSWSILLRQSLLTAYLHYSIPRAYRHWWHRFTHRPAPAH